MGYTHLDGELLDLVDDQDQPIGTVLRAAAHRNPALRHREIRVAVVDTDDRILLCLRPLTKTVNPGVWTIGAAGHVAAGEAPAAAATRELAEELGVELELHFHAKVLVEEAFESYFAYCFAARYRASDGELAADPAEVAEMRFCGRDAARKLLPFDSPSSRVHETLLDAVGL